MIISRTPFRISFFGGGTDYPAWYRNHGGAVLATTIDKYCYLTCRYLPPFFEHRIRVVYSKIESCQTVDEISHPSVREVLRYLNIDRGVEIHHDGDLPARSGMGSSSSFTVGLLHALYALKGQMPSKHQLAQESIYIEQEILKETVGSQDQVSAAHGGFNIIEFSPNNKISIRPMTLTQERIEELNSHLMLFYTGIIRTASNVAESYVNNIENGSRQLRIMNDLLEESITVLNKDKDIAGFGKLLHEAWQTKRSLSKKVSNSNVDEIYNMARSAGAIGGKLTGAGGGGFMLLFVPPKKQIKVREKLNNLIYVPFKFESYGSQIVFFNNQEDYSIIERERAMQSVQAFEELEYSQKG
ncbi:MAG: kinase [Proteobacteria bacterium]|nr:kinase [Pseudomonadota bacterium]MBU4288987.1 kinase [Pseudomonadota bacterium]